MYKSPYCVVCVAQRRLTLTGGAAVAVAVPVTVTVTVTVSVSNHIRLFKLLSRYNCIITKTNATVFELYSQ